MSKHTCGDVPPRLGCINCKFAWWDEGILGGDTPLDIIVSIERILGLEDLECWIYPIEQWDNDQIDLVRKKIEEIGGCEELERRVLDVEYFQSSEDSMTAMQVVGFIVTRAGAPITRAFRNAVIAACDDEDTSTWNCPELRRNKLNEFASAIRAYDGTPIVINQKGLFEKMLEQGLLDSAE